MYKRISIFFAVALVAATTGCSAVRFTGDLSPLRGQKEVNVVIEFAHRFDISEEEFNRVHRLAFQGLTNQLTLRNNQGFTMDDFPNAEYTIHVKVLEVIGGGWDDSNRGATIHSEVSILKKGDTTPLSIVRKLVSPGAQTRDPELRIANPFIHLGSYIGYEISRKLK